VDLKEAIGTRLRAGVLVMVVEEADEMLAIDAVKAAATGFKPITVMSASEEKISDTIRLHPKGKGTLVTCDYLRVFGGNPMAMRQIREIALQVRKGEEYSHLIMIESPGVPIPDMLKGDVEFVRADLPSIPDLREELDTFVRVQELSIVPDEEWSYAVAGAVAGLGRHEAVRLYARCWVERDSLDPVWLRRQKATRVSEKLGGALTFIDAASANDIGGCDSLQAWLDSRKKAFASDSARKFNLPEPKGVLLLGIPGTGKSQNAKVIAKSWGLPLLRLDAGKLFGSLVGQSESQTRQAIDAAEACSPCVLWIDELEKGFGSARGGSLDGGTSSRVFGTLLTWLQEKTKPIFVVATANNIAVLPPELLRKGRFDEIFFVDLPTAAERKVIAEIHLTRRNKSAAEISVAAIADATEGFSGAEIEQVIIDGMFTAFDEGRKLKLDDIIAAASATMPLSRTMKDDIDRLRDWASTRARMASSGSLEQDMAMPSADGPRRPAMRGNGS
jgi:MoxR-like ATPase